MKNRRFKWLLPGFAACLAAGFHLISTQPNRHIPVDVSRIATVPEALSGSGLFREVLFLGDDRDDPEKPEKPTPAYDQLLAAYGG